MKEGMKILRKKHREVVKKYRERKKEQLQHLSQRTQNKIAAERKRLNRERVARHRRLKKGSHIHTSDPGPSTSSPAYKNTKSLGKATARVKQVLPNLPRKKRAVVIKLYDTYIEPLPKLKYTRISALSPDIVKSIKEFYERDDISRQAPGKKDVITVREPMGKNKVQTRHLLYSIKEAHGIFCSENENKVGKSKFAELRPKHVLLSNKLPHNVCLCKYHENFINAINSLHKFVPNFPEYSSDLPGAFICENPKKECWNGNCPSCQDLMTKKIMDICSDFTNETDVKWYVWRECEGRLLKVEDEGTLQDLIDYITTIGPQFLNHCYIKREQSKVYQQQRQEVVTNHDNALLQVDFSENYTCVSQDEIQSAHWQQNQITLFTAALWYSGILHPLTLVSDNTDHSKDTVIAYIDRLLEELPPTTKTINIWSDGPSSQFKNRYIAECIQSLEKKYKKKVTWNYFATSHGKGPVDGIGGSVKRQVWLNVKQRKCNVNRAADFVNTLVDKSNVKIILMTEDELLQRNRKLNLKCIFKSAKTFQGIIKVHCLKVSGGKIIGFNTSAKSE